MNIWKAYCNPSYYNVYFNILVATGINRETAEELKYQYTVYIQRLKNCRFASDLKKCTTPASFKEKLVEIFTVKWKNKMKFREMPILFENYLTFLDSMQALHNDFINPDEEKRLINPNMDYPIDSLTFYETDYIKDGKLVALMNPMLLFILKEYIEVDKASTANAASVCRTFYGDLLPNMDSEDYVELIENLWHKQKTVKKGRKHKQFKIIYPDGTEDICSTTDGIKKIVMYFGFEECLQKKIMIRENPFIVKYIPHGRLKEIYEEIEPGKYINNQGQTKDRLSIVRRICISFNSPLKIELI